MVHEPFEIAKVDGHGMIQVSIHVPDISHDLAPHQISFHSISIRYVVTILDQGNVTSAFSSVKISNKLFDDQPHALAHHSLGFSYPLGLF